MKTGLLGGSFSPITLGHIDLAKSALNVVDRVVLIPCNKHTFGKSLIDPTHRINMCQLVIENNITIDDFEIKHKLPGDTYTLIKKLKDINYFGKNALYFIIGLDEALNFHKWVNFKKLEKMIRFVVIPRSGITINDQFKWFLRSPHVYLKKELPVGVSSTQVRTILKKLKRRSIKMPKSLKSMLNPSVFEYIIKNNLYKGL